jgi:hypothetical protein
MHVVAIVRHACVRYHFSQLVALQRIFAPEYTCDPGKRASWNGGSSRKRSHMQCVLSDGMDRTSPVRWTASMSSCSRIRPGTEADTALAAFLIKPVLSFIAFLFVVAAGADGARALSMDQAMERCKEQVRPLVRACVRKKVMERGGSPDQYIEGCKSPVVAQVRSCVAKLIGAEGFRQNAIDDATPRTPEAVRSAATAARSVAVVPRTIADITAILDQEKPDPSRLKKLHETADGAPPARLDPVALAHFYFGRSVAVRSSGVLAKQ